MNDSDPRPMPPEVQRAYRNPLNLSDLLSSLPQVAAAPAPPTPPLALVSASSPSSSSPQRSSPAHLEDFDERQRPKAHAS